jgi:4-hydroxybenzoate polyprenyltransferase
MQRLLSAIRVNDWWHHLLPPVLAFYFLGLLISRSTVGMYDLATHFVSLLALAIPVAALGFFLNDWTDIEEDIKAGKPNAVAGLPQPVRILILLLLLICLAGIFYIHHYALEVKVLTMIQVLLLFLYSCKPFRWKRYKEAAVVLDALYSSTIPLAIAVILSVGSPDSRVLFLTLLFGFSKGLRNILFHLISDKKSDLLAGHFTLAHRLEPHTLLMVQQWLWLAESLVFLKICKMASPVLFWAMSVLLIFALIKRRYYTALSSSMHENLRQWLSQLNTIYEVWLLLGTGVLVIASRSPLMAIIFFVSALILFPRSRIIFSELKIMGIQLYYLAYNLFYFISDWYFLRVKPSYDLGKLFRRQRVARSKRQKAKKTVAQ